MNKPLMAFFLLVAVLIISLFSFLFDDNHDSTNLEGKIKKLEDDNITLMKSMKQLNYDLEFCNTKQGEYKFRLDMCLSSKGMTE